MRAPKGSTITVVTDPFDGAPENPTVVVAREDGTVLAAPTATVEHHSVGVTLTAADHLDELDELTVTVTADTPGGVEVQDFTVDVIGSHWLTLGALRREPKLSDTAKVPDWLLRDYRDAIESYVEDLCNVAMIPSYGAERHRGRGQRLTLDANEVTALRAVVIDGTAATLSDFTLGAYDTVEGPFGTGTEVVVRFEHGLRRPPAKLRTEVLKAIRAELLRRGAETPTDKIRETSPEGGVTIQYATPDPSAMRWTGMLTLDPVITEYRRAEVGVA